LQNVSIKGKLRRGKPGRPQAKIEMHAAEDIESRMEICPQTDNAAYI